MHHRMTLGELAKLLGAELRGDASYVVTGMATLQSATASQIAFLANPRYRAQLALTQAGAVLLRPDDAADYAGQCLLLANPYLAFSQLSHHFDRTPSVLLVFIRVLSLPQAQTLRQVPALVRKW
jgi:UDP-3-O-[3-hydroxymyristoyl] glucosamine N-acyltransferase